MYRLKQNVEVIYQGRWIQGVIAGLPEGENELFSVNCGLAQPVVRDSTEIHPTRKFHVMNIDAGGGNYSRGVLLEEFYAFDQKCALKIAKQYWPNQKATLWLMDESNKPIYVGPVDMEKIKKI